MLQILYNSGSFLEIENWHKKTFFREELSQIERKIVTNLGYISLRFPPTDLRTILSRTVSTMIKNRKFDTEGLPLALWYHLTSRENFIYRNDYITQGVVNLGIIYHSQANFIHPSKFLKEYFALNLPLWYHLTSWKEWNSVREKKWDDLQEWLSHWEQNSRWDIWGEILPRGK